MTNTWLPQLKNGTCAECFEFRVLTRFRNKYICRDCFVGDYDPEYIQRRLDELLIGEHPLAKAQEIEECNQMRLNSNRSKGRK